MTTGYETGLVDMNCHLFHLYVPHDKVHYAIA